MVVSFGDVCVHSPVCACVHACVCMCCYAYSSAWMVRIPRECNASCSTRECVYLSVSFSAHSRIFLLVCVYSKESHALSRSLAHACARARSLFIFVVSGLFSPLPPSLPPSLVVSPSLALFLSLSLACARFLPLYFSLFLSLSVPRPLGASPSRSLPLPLLHFPSPFCPTHSR